MFSSRYRVAEEGSKDKGTGEPEGILPSSSSRGKCLIESYFTEVYAVSSFVYSRKNARRKLMHIDFNSVTYLRVLLIKSDTVFS